MKTYCKALLFFISTFFVSSVFSQKIATSGPIQKVKLNEKGIYHSFVNVFGNSVICSEIIDIQIRIMPQFQKKNMKTRKYLKYFKKTLLATVQNRANKLSRTCPKLEYFNLFVWKPKYNDHDLVKRFYQVSKSDDWRKLIEKNSYYAIEKPSYPFDFINSNSFSHNFRDQELIFAKGEYHLDGENFTAMYGKFSHQNVGGFIPYTGGGGYMQGKLSPIVSDGLLTHISVSGEWYEDAYIFSDWRGNRGYKVCQATLKQGRSLWGRFTLTLNVKDNSIPEMKWFTCNENSGKTLTVKASGSNTLQASILSSAPQKKYQKYAEDQKKIALLEAEKEAEILRKKHKQEELAAIEIKKQKQKKIASVGFDSVNQLSHWGYTQSKFLFRDKKSEYFIAPTWSQGKMSLSVVVIHNIGNDKNVIDLEVSGRQYVKNSGIATYYKKNIFPKLIEEKKKLEDDVYFNIFNHNHYTANKELLQKDDRVRVSKYAGIIEPILATYFKEGSDRFETIEREPNIKDGYGLSFADANFERVDLNEQHRRRYLPHDQRIGLLEKELNEADEELKSNYNAKGLIYRDWLYWEKYQIYGEKFKKIFEGRKIESERLFKHIYKHYVIQYDLHCEKYLPKNTRGYNIITTTTDSHGYQISRLTDEIKMRPEYFNTFDEYHKYLEETTKKRAAENILKGDLGGLMQTGSNVLKFLSRLVPDISRLFDLEGCNSGFIKQFESNLYRLATKTISLQSSGKHYDFFESDTTYQATRPSIFNSCLIDRLPTSSSSRKFCACIDRSYSSVLNDQEKNYYISNMSELFKRSVPPAQGGTWRLQKAKAKCISR